MRHVVPAVCLVLLLMPGPVLPAEAETLPAPVCLGRDGQPLPGAKDPVRITVGMEERPVVVSNPMPPWPGRVKGCELPPRVWVQAVVTLEGEVCAAGLLKPLPPECAKFSKLAVKGVRKWKFQPLLREGAPVAFLYYVALDFTPDAPR
jgi:hypothetical protein